MLGLGLVELERSAQGFCIRQVTSRKKSQVAGRRSQVPRSQMPRLALLFLWLHLVCRRSRVCVFLFGLGMLLLLLIVKYSVLRKQLK